MNKKFIWLIVSCLMVAALVLASCAPAVVEEKEVKGVVTEPEKKVEEVVEPVVGEPQYGGTLTVWQYAANSAPSNPDMAATTSCRPSLWLSPIQEKPLVGDIDKYGPRGTGEFAFQLPSYTPLAYMKGNLIESWEISHEETVWHVRPGIYWAPNQEQSAWMEARELVAEDIVADILCFMDSPTGGRFDGIIDKVYATDRYTLVIETPRFDVNVMYYLGYEDRANISPPEMIAAGANEWENQVGTGPWMFEEHVTDAYFSYVRNPSYWGTTTIDGVEYQLPFADRLVWPIMPDAATQMAALRTGKLDFHHVVPPDQWQTLNRTAPELLSARSVGGVGWIVHLRNTVPPFDSVDVRRAMMIGTDMEAFAALSRLGPLPKHWFPVYLGDKFTYTPLEELPAETQLLFDYNPDLAKQMLADAGYPNGFEITYTTSNLPDYQDRAVLIKEQWAKIGVDVELVIVDQVIAKKVITERTFTTIMSSGEVSNSIFSLCCHETDSFFNHSEWSNEYFDSLIARIVTEMDVTEQNRLAKEAAVIQLNEAPCIPTDPTVRGHFWWPWLKNYYGEMNADDLMGMVPILSRIWIDQDLKTKMGY